jgi:hypothetical protein
LALFRQLFVEKTKRLSKGKGPFKASRILGLPGLLIDAVASHFAGKRDATEGDKRDAPRD